MIIRRVERETRKKRVAAYCRVSSEYDIQMESYDTQVRVYKEMIEMNPDWEFVAIYADPGISGTSAKKRPEFMRMIHDAEERKFDLLLCKSVSRFGRNAMETHQYVEILKSNCVTIVFEEDNIRTDDPGSSFVFSLMASVAQDESRSIGENVKWGIQQRYARGEFNLGNNHILGYDTVEGKLVPNGEAWVVREVYKRFLNGESYREISDALIAMGAKTKRGKKGFVPATLQGMLQNETYKGDMRLQQTAPKDYLTHRPDPNAEYRSYYLTDDHEAIIDEDTWNKVQAIFAQRKENRENGIFAGKHHPLYGQILCTCCGAPYIRRTLRSKGGEKRKAWSCRNRANGNGCRGQNLWEDEIAV